MLSVNIPPAPCSTPAPSSPINRSINRSIDPSIDQSFTPRSIFNTSNANDYIDSAPATPIHQSINHQSINQSFNQSINQSKFQFPLDTPSPAGFQIYDHERLNNDWNDKKDRSINQPINRSITFEKYDEAAINQSIDQSTGGFHARGSKLRLSEIENKEPEIEVIETKRSINQSNDQSTNQSTSPWVKKFDWDQSANQIVSQPINQQLNDSERLIHLLCCMYRCRECLPTPADESINQSTHQSTNQYSSRKLGEFCCVGAALQASWPSTLPIDLISLTHQYSLQISRTFLTRPAPASAGVIQCFILKDKATNRFELFMEMRENAEFMQLKKELNEASANQSVNEEELRARLFSHRQKRGLKTPTNQSTDQSTNDSDSLAANARSMLVNHARSLIDASNDISLMTAQRRRAWTGNSYSISMSQPIDQSTNQSTSNFLGKLKSNFGGTEFMLYEHGVRQVNQSTNQSKQSINQSISGTIKQSFGGKSIQPISPTSRSTNQSTNTSVDQSTNQSTNQPIYQRYVREAGMIQYDHFFEHTGSPIRIKVALPNQSFHQSTHPATPNQSTNQSPNSLSKQWKLEQQAAIDHSKLTGEPLPDLQAAATPRSQAAESKASKIPVTNLNCDDFDEYSYQTPGQQVEQFENLRPVWHDGMNAYVLHFDHHRVREKSVKNFKLVRTLDGEKKTLLQFGRVLGDRNVFVMDFSYPLSPFQAFAIALSSLDPKIAV